MIEVGRIVIKIAGRDAGKVGTIIEIIDNNYVLVDGFVRRKKVNINHLEFTSKSLNIIQGANTNIVKGALKEAGYNFKDKKQRTKTKTQKKLKPIKKRTLKSEKKQTKTQKKQEKKT